MEECSVLHLGSFIVGSTLCNRWSLHDLEVLIVGVAVGLTLAHVNPILNVLPSLMKLRHELALLLLLTTSRRCLSLLLLQLLTDRFL